MSLIHCPKHWDPQHLVCLNNFLFKEKNQSNCLEQIAEGDATPSVRIVWRYFYLKIKTH